jgi:hypothetical protein
MDLSTRTALAALAALGAYPHTDYLRSVNPPDLSPRF